MCQGAKSYFEPKQSKCWFSRCWESGGGAPRQLTTNGSRIATAAGAPKENHINHDHKSLLLKGERGRERKEKKGEGEDLTQGLEVRRSGTKEKLLGPVGGGLTYPNETWEAT